MSYVLITANRNYSSWSLRPWLLMKELGIPFEDRVEHFAAPESRRFFAFSPTGQVPVLLDGPRTVWDSLGITMYLGSLHAAVWPLDPDAKAWAMSAVAEMHSGFANLRQHCTMNVGVRVRPHPFTQPVQRDIARLGSLWSEGLKRFGGPYLAGARFTAADAFFAPIAFRRQTYGFDLGADGNGWADRMLGLPGMGEWSRTALAETVREPGHEAEMQAAGHVIEDLRAS